MPLEFGEITEKLRRSTVHVNAGGRGQGSGLIIKPEGIIVTNAHVAAATPIQVRLWDGRGAQADLLMRDARRDIAVLSVPLSELPVVQLADSDQLRVGELVIAIGNPWGFLGALTMGVVHGIGRMPGLGPMRWIQADVQLAPGNSGGPLANSIGQMVGINTMISAGIGLAVPSNTVSRVLRGDGSRASLGIVARSVQISIHGKARVGMIILKILKSSPAEAASLMLGDIVIAGIGRSLESMDDLEQLLDGTGERVIRLQFLRGDRKNIRTVAVRLGPQHMAAA